MPKTVTNFAFLSITNLIGFLWVFVLFFGELFRIDKALIKQSLVLSCLSIVYNMFILIGSNGVDAKTISCLLSSYFVFIPIFELILYKKKPDKNVVIGMIVVLFGVFCVTECKIENLFNKNILFLVIADLFIAIYILTTAKYTQGSNPSMLAMGQLFFNFIISGICWVIESIVLKKTMGLPKEPAFWGSVIFISFFIRSLYTIIQIYAQRYISALNTSLVFSTEIIMTMLASPFITEFFALPTAAGTITPFGAVGASLMVFGMLITEPSVIEKILIIKKKTNV